MLRKLLAVLAPLLLLIGTASGQVTSPPVAAQNLVNQTLVQNSTHNTTSQSMHDAVTAVLNVINGMGTWDPMTGKYVPPPPTGLAAVATSGSASDLGMGTLPLARLPTAVTQLGNSATGSGSVVLSSGPTLNAANFNPEANSDLRVSGHNVNASGPRMFATNDANSVLVPLEITSSSLLLNGGNVSVLGGVATTQTPAWASPPTGITDQNRMSDGVFPISAEFGSGTVPVGQGHVAAYDIPSNATFYQWNSLAGYARSGGSPAAVGVFGQLTFSAGGTSTSGDAVNAVCSNGSSQTATTGFSVGNIACLESDTLIRPLTGGGAPSTNAYGLQIAGDASIQPVGNFIGIHVAPPSFGASVPWKQAISTDNGASPIGLNLGSINTSTGSGSQTVNFNSGSGALSTIGNNGGGSLIVNVPLGASINFSDVTTTSSILQGSASAGLTITGGFLQLPPRTYAQAVAARPCNASNAGTFAFISDSTTTTLNATVSGGGSSPATIVCNPTGTGYIVVGG